MGKTPGKWIKSLLLGKKSSKSTLSKGREKTTNKGNAVVSSKLSVSELTVSAPFISPPLVSPPLVGTGAGNEVDSEITPAAKLLNDGVILSSGTEDGRSPAIFSSTSQEGPERIKQEQAATKAQSAYRGYVARRAYRTLKGIIRLQALNRGHLVRRQAVSTLLCVQGIVKFQALIRGQLVRHSDRGVEVYKIHQDAESFNFSGVSASSRVERLSKIAFVQKLLDSLPTSVPLRLQYGPEDPNSAWVWLERWTRSCFWEPVLQPKKNLNSRSCRKHEKGQTIEPEKTKPKRSAQKLSGANVKKGSTRFTSDYEKTKHSLRKVSSHPVNSVREHQRNEVQKIKSNVRKSSDPKKEVSDAKKEVSDPKEEASDQLVFGDEGPKHSTVKSLAFAAPDDSEQGTVKISEKMKHVEVAVSKHSDLEGSMELPPDDESMGKLDAKKEVSNPKEETSDLLVVGDEGPKHSTMKSLASAAPDDSEQGTVKISEKMKHMTVAVSKHSDLEGSVELPSADEPMEKLDNQSSADMQPVENNDTNEEDQAIKQVPNLREHQISNVDKKTSQRRASLPVKFGHQEDGDTPRVPSYMAPTASAKARLRGQGPPRFERDIVEKNVITRRHSLSASTNTNLSSLSPRAQGLVQAAGKGVIRSDRSLSSSKDGFDKAIQPEWRR